MPIHTLPGEIMYGLNRREFIQTAAGATWLVREKSGGGKTKAVAIQSRKESETVSKLRKLSFTVEEYRDRVKKVQREMAKVGMDALLSHNFASICYLTGFQSIMGTAKYFM